MTAPARLEDWIGSTEHSDDVATSMQAESMAATLDQESPGYAEGDPLPPLWHWMLFAPRARQSKLGPDGHPARGGFLPPVQLPRRMYAGGQFRFLDSIRIGEKVRRDGQVVAVDRKQGRSGQLVFVTVRYQVSSPRGLAIEEIQNLVYREPPKGPAAAAPTTIDVASMPWRRTIYPDPVMLFRFSALTFNGHRIHYDHPYATEVEGYPGLVVHGPLIATLLAELAQAHNDGQSLESFRFRALSPLFDTAPFSVVGRPDDEQGGCQLAAINPSGGTAMEATATFGQP